MLARLNCTAVFNLLEEREAENNLLPAEKYLAAPQTDIGLFSASNKTGKPIRELLFMRNKCFRILEHFLYFKNIVRLDYYVQ